MTIASTSTSQQFPCNGTTTQFSFANKVFLSTDLVVTLIDTGGNQWPFTNFANVSLGLSYTVQNVDVDTGCLVVMSAAPANGWTLDVRSAIANLQTTSVKNQGAFFPELHEEFFDKATRFVQDLLRKTYTFGIHGPDIENTPWTPLPIAASRAGYGLVFDSNGLPTLGAPNSVGSITGALVAGLLNVLVSTPVTNDRLLQAAETAAGVTPTNYAYAPLDCRRYGLTTTDGVGSTNATAINNAMAVANKLGGGICTLPPGSFNINAVLSGYTNVFLQGHGMAMGQSTNPDFANAGGTTIVQLNASADVIDFVNTSTCGLRDISLTVGAGGNGVMWESTSGSPAYFQLQNVSVNLAANSAGIGVYLNNTGSTALFFPRLKNVAVTGGSETAYGTKTSFRFGNPSSTSVVVYGSFEDLLANGVQTAYDLQKVNSCKFSGLVTYNIGNTGCAIKGTNATNNQMFGVEFEPGTISTQYINWGASCADNYVFVCDSAMTPSQYVDNGTNNQLFGDDGSGGITNKFGMAANLFDVRRLVLGLNASPGGTPLSLYYAQTVTLSPGAVAAGSSVDTSFSISGVLQTDNVIVTPENGLESGLAWGGYAISGAVRIRVINATTGSITPASRTWNVIVMR